MSIIRIKNVYISTNQFRHIIVYWLEIEIKLKFTLPRSRKSPTSINHLEQEEK